MNASTVAPGGARERPEGCSSDLLLEQLLVDELRPGGARDALLSHLATCLRCQRRRDQLAAAPALAPEPAFWADRASASAPRPTFKRARRTRAGFAAGFAVAGLAAAALWLVPRHDDRAGAGVGSTTETRTKGAPTRLELVARGADGRVFPVFDGTALHPGDAVRFVVTTATTAHVAVVGLDAAGGVTVDFPAADGASDSVDPGTHTLPGSVVLDATMGDERFVALACAAPVSREALARAGARALVAASGRPAATGLLEVPCEQTALSVRKVAP